MLQDPYWLLFFHCLLGAITTLYVLKLPRWWALISILVPLMFVVFNTSISLPGWLYFFLFAMIALFFSHAIFERVPLYLSNSTTHRALIDYALKHQLKNAIDLGCGFGGVVRALDKNGIRAVGVEGAPMTWIVARILSNLFKTGQIKRGNIWDYPLEQIDLVYTFLSPVPMARIYKKAKSELKSGAVLISNSFPVPDVKPTEILMLSDSRKTTLYIYKI